MATPDLLRSVLKQIQECARETGDSAAFVRRRHRGVAAVAVSKNISCHHVQAERIVEFSEGEQPFLPPHASPKAGIVLIILSESVDRIIETCRHAGNAG